MNYRHVTSDMYGSGPNYCRILLLILYSAGLILGILVSHSTDIFSALMRRAAFLPVSIVGLAAVTLLPYLFTAFAVSVCRTRLLIPLAFLKAFLFGACCAGVNQAFGSAGWLIRGLLMFSSVACLPVHLWLWLRCFGRNNNRLSRDFCLVLFLLILIGSLDYLVIAPYLALVISV